MVSEFFEIVCNRVYMTHFSFLLYSKFIKILINTEFAISDRKFATGKTKEHIIRKKYTFIGVPGRWFRHGTLKKAFFPNIYYYFCILSNLYSFNNDFQWFTKIAAKIAFYLFFNNRKQIKKKIPICLEIPLFNWSTKCSHRIPPP